MKPCSSLTKEQDVKSTTKTSYNEGCAHFNINRICEYLESSRSTLDECVPVITCHDLVNSTLRVHRVGDSGLQNGGGFRLPNGRLPALWNSSSDEEAALPHA
ncbi:Protein of unknown function [Gryllus bimaculatus]|nr:Protein of unknown function [Gryllus bimaculatus]